MTEARRASEASADRNRKVGCVVVRDGAVVATGWNGIGTVHGVEDRAERHERPEKYFWAEHAERRAIYEAARFGVGLEGAAIYVSWFPCMDCARAVVECRMAEIVCGKAPDMTDPKWGEDFKRVEMLFAEAGVNARYMEEAK
ncbi:MAG: CMP deaminase [Gemmatimonadaceae bacterium]|nr:CMP deaminase [Gemmatimonadaceae bacterium]